MNCYKINDLQATSPLSTFLFDFGPNYKRATIRDGNPYMSTEPTDIELETAAVEQEAATNHLVFKRSYRWIICNFYMLYGYEV